ncbi:MAG TPA: Arc family DNA-binding protein [Chthonomonadales bacterium]|nr:Arc family DNA-binding protein [Chthonomonadales bacterium]
MAEPERKSLLLRIPKDLWDEIRAAAAADLRSVNGQIEYMLRDALRRRRGGRDAPSDGAST